MFYSVEGWDQSQEISVLLQLQVCVCVCVQNAESPSPQLLFGAQISRIILTAKKKGSEKE